MKIKMKNILLCLLILMFAAIFNYICFDGATKTAATIKAKDTAVSLQATITSYDSYTETDEGVDREYWHEKVSYTYNGVDYSGVFYNRTESKPEIGKVVTVKIDPENPGELLPDEAEVLLSLILSPVFLVGVTATLFFLMMSIAEGILERYGRQNKALAKIISILFIGSKMVVESLAFHNKHNSWVYAVFSLIAAVALLCWGYWKGNNQKEEQETQYVQNK